MKKYTSYACVADSKWLWKMNTDIQTQQLTWQFWAPGFLGSSLPTWLLPPAKRFVEMPHHS